MAWTWSMFIFQLPAMSGVRSNLPLVDVVTCRTSSCMWQPAGCHFCGQTPCRLQEVLAVQNAQTREVLAFEILQAGAAAGGDVTEWSSSKPRIHGGSGVAAAHHGERVGFVSAWATARVPAGEGRDFEDTHGAVPEHGLGALDPVGEGAAESGPMSRPMPWAPKLLPRWRPRRPSRGQRQRRTCRPPQRRWAQRTRCRRPPPASGSPGPPGSGPPRAGCRPPCGPGPRGT